MISTYWQHGLLKQDASALGELNRQGVLFSFYNNGNNGRCLKPENVHVRIPTEIEINNAKKRI